MSLADEADLFAPQSCSPLLLSELVHPQHRPQYTTIYNSLWYVGAVIGSVVALGKPVNHVGGYFLRVLATYHGPF